MIIFNIPAIRLSLKREGLSNGKVVLITKYEYGFEEQFS